MTVRLRNLILKYAMINAYLAILFLILSGTTYSAEHVNIDLCSQYDWGKVESLVEPYLNENLMTILVQQGISAEYNTSSAADQALGSATFPANINDILNRLSNLNCP